jgi:hypothetical protein
MVAITILSLIKELRGCLGQSFLDSVEWVSPYIGNRSFIRELVKNTGAP